jgi:hypothetical protein
MIVAELCEAAGITRQWLNKRVDMGDVPGCRRKPNERLEIRECPELDEWIKTTSHLQKTKRGRRLTLSERLERLEAGSSGKNYTVTELAKKTGVTASTITRRILEIPGAYFDGIRYRFQNTPDLAQWVEAEIVGRQQAKENAHRQHAKEGTSDLAKLPFLRACAAISNARVQINRATKISPVKMWKTEEIQAFAASLQYMGRLAQAVVKELDRRES